MKNTPPIVILNQELVREKLRLKKYDDVCLSGWGHLDEFIHFIISFGILGMLAQLGLTTGHSGVPVSILAMLAFVKPLFGIRFDDNSNTYSKTIMFCGFLASTANMRSEE